MTPLEAMHMLIALGDRYFENLVESEALPELSPDDERLLRANTLIRKMLDTALPVARFRCFVSVDKATTIHKSPITAEYTICSPTIEGVIAGLIGLSENRTDVQATLWEQRTASADMISGWQGRSRSPSYKRWIKSLEVYSNIKEKLS